MGKTIPLITLNDGLQIPSIGLGTYALNGAQGVSAIQSALDNGYRLLDTAFNYENEGAVGEAIRRSSVAREEIIVTSKLPGRHHRYDRALKTIQESLYRLHVDYLDIYLIHWPNPKRDLYVEAWQALIDAKKWGLVRSIGVCNFNAEHIDRLLQETGVAPSINQIKLHPRFSQVEQLAYNQSQGIVTEAWSPLERSGSVLQDEKLIQIAKEHGKTPGQIILRWHIQLGAVPLPKSASPKRQLENLQVFDFALNEQEMQLISSLTSATGRINNQDPAEYEEF